MTLSHRTNIMAGMMQEDFRFFFRFIVKKFGSRSLGLCHRVSLQCFDTVGWATGRASGL